MSTFSTNVGNSAAWEELLGKTGSRDLRGKGGVERRFKVTGVELETLLHDPTSVVDPEKGPLPAFGTFHPNQLLAGRGYILDTYRPDLETKTTGGNNVLQVSALYSNDRRFQGAPHVDPTGNNGTRDARPTFERTVLEYDIPIAVQETVDEGLPSEVTRYGLDSRRVQHVAYKKVYELQFSGWTSAMAEAVASQSDTVHFINGKWRLFEAGDAYPVEDTGELTNVYSITYSWVEDPGTRTIGGGLGGGSTANPPPLGDIVLPPRYWGLNSLGAPAFGQFAFVRPPFYHIVPVFINGIKQPPFFDVFTNLTFNATGYQSLPGYGRLGL
ncbi:MAG: hypothetical protein B7733_13115 [Myxococcales bacterium FL481]|nr:MAG: hypothetical protein B7733_13115 [Myxococcales bacterium FL481]